MKSHLVALDSFTPAQIRVVCEQLLYTMDCNQRGKLANEFPGLYRKLYNVIPDVVKNDIAREMIIGMEQEIDRQRMTIQGLTQELEATRNIVARKNDQLSDMAGLPAQLPVPGSKQPPFPEKF